METQTGKTELPGGFAAKMRELLGEEWEEFFKSYDREKAQGLRLNPLKAAGEQEIVKLTEEFGLRKVPWAREGYYFDKETRPGKHPYHDAGVFYIQEPSAMAAAEILDPVPGERVLDLCAAPGGKTTHIAGRLLGRGLLVSNEIHPARAKILSQNVERLGVANAVVTSGEAGSLARIFPGFFDKILVDAPCSGEGMFRKDQEAREQWSLENVAMCARRQGEILDQAGTMLRPGGRMVYSTCTFSPEENEGTISGFLERNPDFSVERAQGFAGLDRGRPEWIEGGREDLEYTFRIWPHRTEGEGHYLAVLVKGGEREQSFSSGRRKQNTPPYVKDRQVIRLWRTFAEETLSREGLEAFREDGENRLVLFGEQLYRIPREMPDYRGLRVLRAGLHLGTVKKNRFEPSHGLALYLKKEQVKRWQSFQAAGPDMSAYLRGETMRAEGGREGGWTLVLAGEYSAGWAKQVGEVLKNHYPKGLRRLL